MDAEQDFRYIPKRKLTEAEKQIIMLKIEKVKLQRQRSILILNKSVMLFFAFLAVAVIGVINKIVTATQLDILVFIGILALLVGVLPYSISSRKEENELEKTIDELTN